MDHFDTTTTTTTPTTTTTINTIHVPVTGIGTAINGRFCDKEEFIASLPDQTKIKPYGAKWNERIAWIEFHGPDGAVISESYNHSHIYTVRSFADHPEQFIYEHGYDLHEVYNFRYTTFDPKRNGHLMHHFIREL